jgi:hypothetical protein
MLNTQPHFQACDDFYEALIAAHQGLSTPQSHAMNARLVLLLANHIGDQVTLMEALQLARGVATLSETAPTPERQAITPVAPAHATG